MPNKPKEGCERLDGLPDDVHAFALAGFFLAHFNRTEIELKTAIGRVLGLDEERTIILTADMPFARTVDIAVTIINKALTGSPQAPSIKRRINRLKGINTQLRVPIAHQEFGFSGRDLAIRTRARIGTKDIRKISRSEILSTYNAMLKARDAAHELVVLVRRGSWDPGVVAALLALGSVPDHFQTID